ncbi:NUMOD4 motif-containing HNH endonuclease [Variovorax sp. UMC13]|uniref:NUMOD4 motif-containing HNH endonuclease n=1 Tax=Variovorax sp. UMC13 TaxID=1862326 RepID=UPI00160394AC|nr:NUMOD4 motif-containing HNH endonuclease [Variovorax sp. UMC13]
MTNSLMESAMEEIWKPVLGFETHYEVSNLGAVRSVGRSLRIRGGGIAFRRGRVLRPFRMGDYLGVSLSADNQVTRAYVHRLVAEAFCDPRDGCLEVSHENHDRQDNRAANLEWSTHQENEDHKHRSGRRVRGSDIGTSKLTAEDILEVQLMLIGGAPQSALAVMFDVGQSTISKIKRGEIWGHLTVAAQQAPSPPVLGTQLLKP